MQKYLDSMHTEKPLQIKSAMCTDVKGYICVEAYKEVHAAEPRRASTTSSTGLTKCQSTR